MGDAEEFVEDRMDDSLNEGGICVEECPKLMGGNLIDAVAANERENRGAGESISVMRGRGSKPGRTFRTVLYEDN